VGLVLRGGRRVHRAQTNSQDGTLHQLLAGDAGDARGLAEVHIPRALLSDLYDHPVVITPEYIGRDRRAPVVSEWPDRRSEYPGVERRLPAAREVEIRRDRGLPGLGLRSLEVILVIIATLAVAVPLTLMAGGTKAPAIANLSPVSPKVPTQAASPGIRTLAAQGSNNWAARRAASTAARAHLASLRSERRASAEAARQTTAAANRAARARHAVQERALRHADTVRRQELLRRDRAERAARYRAARRGHRT
jgi:hypothetical protein